MSVRSIHHDDIDAVIDTRARRRCQLERRGADPVSIAVHLLIETGDAPGWDADLDGYDGWDTAA
ncbi:hypothetical protein OHA40_16835 [Nocardia sp. NBC_00508]|uniref:hypothetical protein n=1 Tax=Nocardia sp. NBC_00508 TaxID=2975992 RepID=UPI002E816577|nr:hypothetical protein [Nocardia sp. NBC_00508]WUD69634.1 hypothetical protein OHA40_16835 [Nocardia sp. NBC_00508]